MDEDKRCIHCAKTIRQINYALGPEWMHVVPEAGFPSTRAETAWKHCKNTVATPPWTGQAQDE